MKKIAALAGLGASLFVARRYRAMRDAYRKMRDFLMRAKGLTEDEVTGAKVWATPHFSLAPARLGRIVYGCAAATVAVRAEPSRA